MLNAFYELSSSWSTQCLMSTSQDQLYARHVVRCERQKASLKLFPFTMTSSQLFLACAMDVEHLFNRLPTLQPHNSALAGLIQREFWVNSIWFPEFKGLRDSEGVHRTRISRNLIIIVEAPGHRIQIKDYDVDIYSIDTILRINDALESGYNLM